MTMMRESVTVPVQQTVVMSQLTALNVSLRVRNSLASRETVSFSNETFAFRVGTNYKLNSTSTLFSAEHGAVYWRSTVLFETALFGSEFFFVALRPNADQGLLIFEVSRSHETRHHSR